MNSNDYSGPPPLAMDYHEEHRPPREPTDYERQQMDPTHPRHLTPCYHDPEDEWGEITTWISTDRNVTIYEHRDGNARAYRAYWDFAGKPRYAGQHETLEEAEYWANDLWTQVYG